MHLSQLVFSFFPKKYSYGALSLNFVSRIYLAYGMCNKLEGFT